MREEKIRNSILNRVKGGRIVREKRFKISPHNFDRI